MSPFSPDAREEMKYGWNPISRRRASSAARPFHDVWADPDALEQLPDSALEVEGHELELDLDDDVREKELINSKLGDLQAASRRLQLLQAMVAIRSSMHQEHLSSVNGELNRRVRVRLDTGSALPGVAPQEADPSKPSKPKKPSRLQMALHRLKEEVDVHSLWVNPVLCHERGDHHDDKHQDEVDEEARKATWTELFFDLVYVAAGLKLGEALKRDLSWSATLQFCAVFVPLFAVWIRSCEYQNRFYSKDLISKAVFGSYFVVTVAVAVHCDDPLGKDATGFMTSLALVKVILALQYLEVAITIPSVKNYAALHAVTFFLFAVLYLSMIAVPEALLDDKTDQKTFRGIFVVAETIIARLVSVAEELYTGGIPVHTELQHERYCLFTVLVLGETVLGIILPDIKHTTDYFATAAASAVMIFCIQYLYFEVDNFRFLKHALDRFSASRFFRHLFLYLHLLLYMTCLMLGVGVKCTLYYSGKVLKQKYRHLLCVNFALVVMTSMLIHVCHALPRFEIRIGYRFAVRAAASVASIALGFIPYKSLSAVTLIWLLATIALLLTFFEFMAANIPDEEEKAEAHIAVCELNSEEHHAHMITEEKVRPRLVSRRSQAKIRINTGDA